MLIKLLLSLFGTQPTTYTLASAAGRAVEARSEARTLLATRSLADAHCIAVSRANPATACRSSAVGAIRAISEVTHAG